MGDSMDSTGTRDSPFCSTNVEQKTVHDAHGARAIPYRSPTGVRFLTFRKRVNDACNPENHRINESPARSLWSIPDSRITSCIEQSGSDAPAFLQAVERCSL